MRVVLPPEQMVFVPVMDAAGLALTVTVRLAVAEPHELEAVTVYVEVVAGDTVIAPLLDPVFQRYVLPPEAVRVTDPPAQIFEVSGEMDGTGGLQVEHAPLVTRII